MNTSKTLVLFLALSAIFTTACADADDHPPMAESVGGGVMPSGSGTSSVSNLVVSMPGNAPLAPIKVASGSQGKAVMPITLCATGGDLTVANLQVAITSNDGGSLLLDDGQPVFTNVVAGKSASVLLGPGEYDATAIHEDPMTTFPAITVSLRGPMIVADGHCEDLTVSLDIASVKGASVVGHTYSMVFCAICAGAASVETAGVYASAFTVTR